MVEIHEFLFELKNKLTLRKMFVIGMACIGRTSDCRKDLQLLLKCLEMGKGEISREFEDTGRQNRNSKGERNCVVVKWHNASTILLGYKKQNARFSISIHLLHSLSSPCIGSQVLIIIKPSYTLDIITGGEPFLTWKNMH